MKNIITFISILFTTMASAQIDTLVVNAINVGFVSCYLFNEKHCELKDSLINGKSHKFYISTTSPPISTEYFDMESQNPYKSRRIKKHIKELQTLLDKRLSEVKVLVITNPTFSGSYNDSSPIITYDTLRASIYKLNFKKMTSLQEVYLIGDDSDGIKEMPFDFYSTPVKTVYCRTICTSRILGKNIQKKRKDINFIGNHYYINFSKEFK